MIYNLISLTFRVISCDGPTNTRRYTVAVYFRNKRLATGIGHSIHLAEMDAAEKGLNQNKGLLINYYPFHTASYYSNGYTYFCIVKLFFTSYFCFRLENLEVLKICI